MTRVVDNGPQDGKWREASEDPRRRWLHGEEVEARRAGVPSDQGQLPWEDGGALATPAGVGSRRGGRRGVEGREPRDCDFRGRPSSGKGHLHMPSDNFMTPHKW